MGRSGLVRGFTGAKGPDHEFPVEYLGNAAGKCGTEGNPELPDIILLDLNMPGMGGMEFLKRVKQDETFNHIPVVILTTSNSERDMLKSYKLEVPI